MLSTALFAKLSATATVTDLVDDRIYPEWVKQGDNVRPLIMYKIEGVDAQRAFDGPVGLEMAQAVIAAVGDTYPQAADLADAIQTAIDQVRGTWGTVVVQGCFLNEDGINDDVVTEPQSSTITAYVKTLTFTVAYERP